MMSAVALLAPGPAWSAHSVQILVQAARPGALIHAELYGQEIGGAAAGGLWVGPESGVPNMRGWRLDMVEALKRLHPPLLRWPGGCAADDYHWRDGVGPRDQRPLRLGNDNSVGTHEFFDLVELTSSSAYVSANVGTGSAREAAEWVEYMAAEGASTLSQARARHGHPEPFKPRLVGIGAAPWGCGGNMSPQYYADLYNQYAVFIRGKSNHPPTLVANGRGPEWTAELNTRKRVRDYRDAIGAYYGAPATAPAGSEGMAGAGQLRWISALKWALDMDGFIAQNIALLDQGGPARKLSLVIDGCGSCDTATAAGPAGGAQPDTLRDALVAALHFHVLHAHADRIGMASFSAPLNSPRAMLLAQGPRLTLTPTYHAFRMHVPFQGASALPVRLDHVARYAVGKVAVPLLSVSAARARDGKLYLSLVNADPKQAVALAVQLAGAVPAQASASTLTAAAMDGTNSLAAPQAVAPMPLQVRSEHGRLLITLPSKSLTVVAIDE